MQLIAPPPPLQLRSMLNEFGFVKALWLNNIKTHCYAVFESKEQAEAARKVLLQPLLMFTVRFTAQECMAGTTRQLAAGLCWAGGRAGGGQGRCYSAMCLWACAARTCERVHASASACTAVGVLP